jgi:YVTN family beta-propeller protein
MKLFNVLAASFILLAFSLTLNAQTSGYTIANKFHLDGDEGWDMIAVDESTGRIFESHGSMVQVVDEATGTLLGTIGDMKGVHGIAFATDQNKGFISCGRDSSVTVFDLKTLSVTGKISMTGKNADAIVYDEFTHRVFVFNGGSSNATVVDASTNAVVGTVTLDGRPEFSVSDGKGKVYINIEDKSMVNVINPTTMQVEQHWPIAPGEEPSGIALDNINHILFIACSNNLMVMADALTGKIITTVPIGNRVDGADYDPVTKRAFAPSGEGSLTVIQEESKDKFTVIETVPTQTSARTIAVDKKTHHIFLPAADLDDPPPPTTENPHPRPKIKPGTFVILDIMPTK